MGRRTIVELLRIVLGVIVTGVIANLASWSVPNARGSIWGVAWGIVAVVIFLGLKPLRAAWEADRDRADASDE